MWFLPQLQFSKTLSFLPINSSPQSSQKCNQTMAGASEVKLLGHWNSPFVMRARVALNLKGVSYELLPETLGSPSELLVKSNPVYKKFPVLIHDDKPICESMVIVQYFDEVWSSSGPAILPADPHYRAVARFWATYIEEKWNGMRLIMAPIIAPTEEAKAQAVEGFYAILLVLEEAFKICSKGKDYFGGDTIGYVDIALGSCLGWLEVVSKLSGVKFLNKEKVPLLVGWAERFYLAEAVRELVPDTDDLLEISKVVIAYYGSRSRA